MKCITEVCVFCQRTQNYCPLRICSTCCNYGGIDIENDLHVECNANGYVIDGKYYEKKEDD